MLIQCSLKSLAKRSSSVIISLSPLSMTSLLSKQPLLVRKGSKADDEDGSKADDEDGGQEQRTHLISLLAAKILASSL